MRKLFYTDFVQFGKLFFFPLIAVAVIINISHAMVTQRFCYKNEYRIFNINGGSTYKGVRICHNSGTIFRLYSYKRVIFKLENESGKRSNYWFGKT